MIGLIFMDGVGVGLGGVVDVNVEEVGSGRMFSDGFGDDDANVDDVEKDDLGMAAITEMCGADVDAGMRLSMCMCEL